MGLSSNSIFHFTNSLRNLNGILSENFKLRYCRETIYREKDHFDFLIPMVSFCDIPFSQLFKQFSSYGCYGIGLKKSWAEKKGLNPVLYLEKNSHLSGNFLKQLYNSTIEAGSDLNNFTIQQKYMFDVFRYLKNYQGELKRFSKKNIKDYRFSDEREWRYVLSLEKEQLFLGNIKEMNNSEMNIKSGKMILNDSINDERLDFEPEDINYIIIKKENERDKVIRILETVKGKFPHDQVKRLTSRIISTEQIFTDF